MSILLEIFILLIFVVCFTGFSVLFLFFCLSQHPILPHLDQVLLVTPPAKWNFEGVSNVITGLLKVAEERGTCEVF